jgi:predicted nucleic acid-binding protein
MAGSPRRIYWDACTWIAWIQRETLFVVTSSGTFNENREQMCRVVIEAAKRNQIELVTSTLSLVEVCKNPGLKDEGEDKLAAFFEQDYLLLVNLDRHVGERARRLMMSGYSGLKPPDACHLATACVANVEEMHTFDDRLLKLSDILDKADGTKLKIRKPDPGGPPTPLLDKMNSPIQTPPRPDS